MVNEKKQSKIIQPINESVTNSKAFSRIEFEGRNKLEYPFHATIGGEEGDNNGVKDITDNGAGAGAGVDCDARGNSPTSVLMLERNFLIDIIQI